MATRINPCPETSPLWCQVGPGIEWELSDLLSSPRCAAVHLDSVSGMLSPPAPPPHPSQLGAQGPQVKPSRASARFLLTLKGWSYASFQGNSLLCNQIPLFHNHSTLTTAQPLHLIRSAIDSHKYGSVSYSWLVRSALWPDLSNTGARADLMFFCLNMNRESNFQLHLKPGIPPWLNFRENPKGALYNPH